MRDTGIFPGSATRPLSALARFLSRQTENPMRTLVLPLLAGSAALSIAYVGSLIVGQGSEAIGGANGLVESLSGRSTSFLGSVGALAPLGFAFAAGMAATVNPCGFAMLPAYLGLYMGSNEKDRVQSGPLTRLRRALLVGGIVSAGLVLLFGVAGVIIGSGGQFVVDIMPWLGLGIGVVLTMAGAWLLGGHKLYTGFASQVGSRIGNPNQVSVRGYFLFGVSYGTASLSCTLPIFLAIVGTTLVTSGILAATGQFILYGLGMGVVIMALTLG
ncbi:MAG: hypothetical protein O6920_02990, partial [Chloroflexi bacterium]|nr:hypothetical protein [Chloroflexota bacterium]